MAILISLKNRMETTLIPPEAFKDIIEELERRPLYVNQYRKQSGAGRSQCFGLVNRRCLAPDYSRTCWMRPQLYKLLLEFAQKYINFPYTSITLNQNYLAKKHKDRGNVGESLVVAFGNYEGGELALYDGDEKQLIDVKHKPIIRDFSKTWHGVEPFSGNRYSLVFYTLNNKGIDISTIPAPSVVYEKGRYLFKRGDEVISKGLAHPLRGRKKKEDVPQISIEHKEIIIDLN